MFLITGTNSFWHPILSIKKVGFYIDWMTGYQLLSVEIEWLLTDLMICTIYLGRDRNRVERGTEEGWSEGCMRDVEGLERGRDGGSALAWEEGIELGRGGGWGWARDRGGGREGGRNTFKKHNLHIPNITFTKDLIYSVSYKKDHGRVHEKEKWK